jgi:dTDP-4-dehydrorhamnose reductase
MQGSQRAPLFEKSALRPQWVTLNDMKLLVIGASGLLGGRLAKIFSEQFDVVASRHRSAVVTGLASVGLDVEYASSVEKALKSTRADAVLHAAALASTEACEQEPDRARRVNVDGSEMVARACAARGVRLVAISTDLVFDGSARDVDESHRAAPLMVYGRTKLDAEQAVLTAHPRSAIARVALMIGRGFGPRGTASEAIAWDLKAGRRPALFTDEYRTPVDAESLAPALAALLSGTQTGRFHFGGPERISRYELGRRVARSLGLDENGIDAVKQSDRPSAAPRPADVSLDSSRARRELGYKPRPLEESLRDGRAEPDATA